MIRHYEEMTATEPEQRGHLQWGPALGAGLIPGVLLLVVPRGSPWAGVSFFSEVVMGRAMPLGLIMPLPVLVVVHLVVAEIYGLLISLFLTRITQGRAVLAGGALAGTIQIERERHRVADLGYYEKLKFRASTRGEPNGASTN